MNVIGNISKTDSYGVIYCITNTVNKKCYIGQTTNPDLRIKNYIQKRCKGQIKLYNAIQKHGNENFTFEIIDTAVDQIQLDLLENLFISKYDSIKNGYNCKEGGANGKFSEETRQKMSNSHKGIKFSEDHRNNLSKSLTGHIISEGTKQKISKAHIGTKASQDIRNLLSSIHKGEKNAMYGRKHSQESIQKMSEARQQYWKTKKEQV